jgi:hypothetical protein
VKKEECSREKEDKGNKPVGLSYERERGNRREEKGSEQNRISAI